MNDEERAENLRDFGHDIYEFDDTLVLVGSDGKKCWQLRSGDYLGELPKNKLTFVKRAILSD